ncbi:MAG: hypothetical protein OEZ10_07890 [Gammaproteobacteria bacterium]|nr:hypothetical protein [Gammaproteobacteria bacterium]
MYLFLKAGVFQIGDEHYVPDDSWTNSVLNITPQSDESSAFGMEWTVMDEWLIGFELYHTVHEWRSPQGNSGEIEASSMLFSCKQMFLPKAIINPYVGAGFGWSVISMDTGDAWDDQDSFMLHFGVGAIMKFGKVSTFLELRHMDAIFAMSFADYRYYGDGVYGGIRLEL